MTDSRNRHAVPLIGIVLIAIFAAFFTLIYPKIASSTVYMTLGDGIFQASLATNDAQRENGLSDVSELSDGRALLMVFPNEANWGIWMKDMKIPIDIIWLNSDKKVVYVVTNASPKTSADTVFTPKLAAKYVIELPAGTVESKSIKLNSLAAFEIDPSVKVE